MRRGTIAWMIVGATGLVACVRDSLQPCGALACPSGATCIDDRCVPVEAASACMGLPDGAPCATTQVGDGACRSGVCVVAGCGNGVVETAEVCDDGNQDDGDGCSARCDSREACGDGVTNVGEQCDCGTDPAQVRPPCIAVNSNTDELAGCREDCTLRSCNNGIVEGLEQCEPTALLTATCRDVGFYDGTLGCTPFCRFDVSQCTGRCGDGVRESFEACDGADMGAASSCTQIGYYEGTLECSPICTYGGCSGYCGDGTRDATHEVCDGADVPTCAALGFYGPGTPACTGACTVTPGNCARCGDGIVQSPPEACDGSDLRGQDCASFGWTPKPFQELSCSATCGYDFSGCETCGDGVCQPALGETCQNCLPDCCCEVDPLTNECMPGMCAENPLTTICALLP